MVPPVSGLPVRGASSFRVISATGLPCWSGKGIATSLQVLDLRLLGLHGQHEGVLGERLRRAGPLNGSAGFGFAREGRVQLQGDFRYRTALLDAPLTGK